MDEKTLETDTKENGSKKFLAGILVGGLFALLIGFLYVRSNSNQLKLSGNAVTEERDVSDFSKLSIRNGGVINLVQGDEESLTATADEEFMQYVKTYVSGDELVLEIDYPDGFGSKPFLNADVEYDLMVKNLSRITIEGSGKIISSKLSAEEMQFNIDGSGNIESGLEVSKLVTKISGSGTLDLTGKADNQDVTISGSGNYKGKDLEGLGGLVKIGGSGKVEINVSDSLGVEIDGNGKVVYYGDPQIESTNISGSGTIEKAN